MTAGAPLSKSSLPTVEGENMENGEMAESLARGSHEQTNVGEYSELSGLPIEYENPSSVRRVAISIHTFPLIEFLSSGIE